MDKATEIFGKSVEFLQHGKLIEAEAGFNYLLDRNRESPDLWFYIGTVHLSRGNSAVAELCFKRNIELDPKSVHGYNNLGFIYKNENWEKKAEQMFLLAIENFPKGVDSKELATMYNNLATLYVNNGTPEKAIEYCNQALKYEPDNRHAVWNRALAHLEAGNWALGWEDHEAGFRGDDNPLKSPKRKEKDYGCPRWDGSPGKTVVVYGEQGLGDEIMFASMLPDLEKVCKKVIYDCHPRLMQIMRESFPNIDVYGTRKDTEMAWPALYEIDAKVAIGSLGKWFRNKSEDFPKTPYLSVPAAPIPGSRPKIGISWKGGYKSTRKDLRSVTLDQLLPILQLDADFYSLQYTKGADKEIQEFTERTGIVIHHDQQMIDNYDQTAGFIQGLDVVVSVCTSIIHLSGSLGVPCWCLTPSRPAWRYGVKGDMPWYESVRLYRQKGDDWDSVINKIKGDLCKQFPKTIAA